MGMLAEVQEFVAQCFATRDKNQEGLLHFEKTVTWLLRLQPDADEAMQIAAFAHDIERAFRSTDSAETFKNKSLTDPEHLTAHQTKGADIIKKFLVSHGYDAQATDRVWHMIRYHEEGGDPESDLIRDADSLSYLEINGPKHIINLLPKLGYEKVREKIDYMYTRIGSDSARQLAVPLYQSLLQQLATAAQS